MGVIRSVVAQTVRDNALLKVRKPHCTLLRQWRLAENGECLQMSGRLIDRSKLNTLYLNRAEIIPYLPLSVLKLAICAVNSVALRSLLGVFIRRAYVVCSPCLHSLLLFPETHVQKLISIRVIGLKTIEDPIKAEITIKGRHQQTREERLKTVCCKRQQAHLQKRWHIENHQLTAAVQQRAD